MNVKLNFTWECR